MSLYKVAVRFHDAPSVPEQWPMPCSFVLGGVQTAALKNLGLNIRRAKIKKTQDEKMVINKFYITDAVTSEKVLRSSRLEEIRATIFGNLLYYHPEAQEDMAWGAKARKPSAANPLKPLGPRKRCSLP